MKYAMPGRDLPKVMANPTAQYTMAPMHMSSQFLIRMFTVFLDLETKGKCGITVFANPIQGGWIDEMARQSLSSYKWNSVKSCSLPVGQFLNFEALDAVWGRGLPALT